MAPNPLEIENMPTLPPASTPDNPSSFAAAVAAGLSDLTAVSPGLCPGCNTCRQNYDYSSQTDFDRDLGDDKICDEPHFSWGACECCGRKFGGNRYAAHGLDKDNTLEHFEICEDCLCYLANGDEPEENRAHAKETA